MVLLVGLAILAMSQWVKAELLSICSVLRQDQYEISKTLNHCKPVLFDLNRFSEDWQKLAPRPTDTVFRALI